MNQIKVTLLFAICLLFTGVLQAQESPTAAGGEATGSEGHVSYSVGQVTYTTNAGTATSVAQGVQQPYEISTIVGLDEMQDQLTLDVFPNPSSDFVQLRLDQSVWKGWSYQLFNMDGQLLKTHPISSNISHINLGDWTAATYLLKVTDNDQVIKTFKIIKNGKQ